MKTIIIIFMLLSIFLMGCGNSKYINGQNVETVGLFTNDNRVQCVDYDIIMGNVLWSVILFETFVFPVYFVGFSLYEPVGLIPGCISK